MERVDAAADSIAGFEQVDGEAGAEKVGGGGETRDAGAEDEDVGVRHLRWRAKRVPGR